MRKIKQFIEQETVMTIALLLAVVSCVAVQPHWSAVAESIDFRVLAILLSLMMVVAGLQKIGLFDYIGIQLLIRVKGTKSLVMSLVMLCFFLSMLFTNDVALITFVPFAIFVLEKSGHRELMVQTIVFQTVAANLGSMLTPIGNPQNLYIYNYYGFTPGEFMETMIPYAAAAFLLLSVLILIGKKEEVRLGWTDFEKVHLDKKQLVIYGVLFAVSLLAVANILHYYIVLAAVAVTILVVDRSILPKVEYCLIFTFIFFFIFIGNMGNIEMVREILAQFIQGNEVLVSIIASQSISNVPATLLLAEFTDNARELLVGVNLGGLGTLIASMASLISYKAFAHKYNEEKGRYLLWFTVINLLFLAVMCGLRMVI